MKRFLMLVGVAAVAAAMYVAASPASQSSKGPTEKQFLALKKTVTTLNKKLKAAKAEADFDTAYIGCLVNVSNNTLSILALPVSQLGTSSPGSGFLFGASAATAQPTTALDETPSNTTPDEILQAFDPTCLSSGLKHRAVHLGGAARLHSWIAKNTG